jgi:large subunit ribosomal protein L15
MFTSNLKKIVDKRKKRIGRGPGSGKGFHTVGKGQKGQTSRAGYSRKRGFEGGQVPISRRLPVYRGFKVSGSDVTAVRISKMLDKNIFEIDQEALAALSSQKNLKLVGDKNYENYDLSKVVVKQGVVISNSLKEKILASGGKVEEVSE